MASNIFSFGCIIFSCDVLSKLALFLINLSGIIAFTNSRPVSAVGLAKLFLIESDIFRFNFRVYGFVNVNIENVCKKICSVCNDGYFQFQIRGHLGVTAESEYREIEVKESFTLW